MILPSDETGKPLGALGALEHHLLGVEGALVLEHDGGTAGEVLRDAETAEMTKNTIRKLSAIVNERDVEIEALKQKNDSLLSILQTPNGAQPDG